MAEDTFFLKETYQKRNYLWIYWCLTIFGFLWLLFALIADQIISAEIAIQQTATFTESSKTYWCGWKKITSMDGTPTDYKYSKCDSVSCATNQTAGEVWIAFNILAIILGYTTLGYGFFFDIRQGAFDVTTVEPIATRLGCTCKFGYTILGTFLLLFWQLLGLIIYTGVETCSSKEMWEPIFLNKNITFSSTGGASLALNIVSLVFIALGLGILLLIRIQYGNLPKSQNSPATAKKETAPKVVVKKNEPTVAPSTEAAEATQAAPTTQAPTAPAEPPQSKLFNPTRTYQDINKSTTPEPPKPKPKTNNNNALPNKPSGSPPIPGNKPKGPPPVPPKV